MNHVLLQKTPCPSKPESVIHREWTDLHALMLSNHGIVSPNRFVHYVQELAAHKKRDMFTGWAQNDITEFLLFMIECFHNSIARKVIMKISGTKRSKRDRMAYECYQMLKQVYENEYSEIMDMFYAIYVSELASLDGKVVHSMKPEMFFVLDLPIPVGRDPVTLYDCFDLFVQGETLAGENAWWNPDTQTKEDIRKSITFWNLPKIMVLTLTRFCPSGHRKISTTVTCPVHDLNMTKYVSGYQADTYVYSLYGVCNHHGGVHGGHYTVVVNNLHEWVHYNDTRFTVVDDVTTHIGPQTYCLFYRKQATKK
jgi:hypothetical protein